MALNAKQTAFVSAYLVHKNATQAAKDAGYSERSAGMHGNRLMQKDEIKAAIGMKLVAAEKKLDISAERILGELAKLGFTEKDIMKRDKIRALELLGKNQRLFIENIEITDKNSIAEKVKRFKKNGV